MIVDPGFDVRQPSFYCDKRFGLLFFPGTLRLKPKLPTAPNLKIPSLVHVASWVRVWDLGFRV